MNVFLYFSSENIIDTEDPTPQVEFHCPREWNIKNRVNFCEFIGFSVSGLGSRKEVGLK